MPHSLWISAEKFFTVIKWKSLPDFLSKFEQKYLLNIAAISHQVFVSQGSLRVTLKYYSPTDNLIIFIILKFLYKGDAFIPVFCAITQNVRLSTTYNQFKNKCLWIKAIEKHLSFCCQHAKGCQSTSGNGLAAHFFSGLSQYQNVLLT